MNYPTTLSGLAASIREALLGNWRTSLGAIVAAVGWTLTQIGAPADPAVNETGGWLIVAGVAIIGVFGGDAKKAGAKTAALLLVGVLMLGASGCGSGPELVAGDEREVMHWAEAQRRYDGDLALAYGVDPDEVADEDGPPAPQPEWFPIGNLEWSDVRTTRQALSVFRSYSEGKIEAHEPGEGDGEADADE